MSAPLWDVAETLFCSVNRLHGSIQTSVSTTTGLGFTVFMNIVGAIFAITGVVLYAIDLANASLDRLCERSSSSVQNADSCQRVALIAQCLGVLRMSISMSKADGVAVFTVTSDTKSSWPALCQILKALCYSPVCCSVSERLRRIQGSSQTALGILQIIVGLLNIGLGIILRVTEVRLFPVTYMLCPVWLGVLFMVFGTVCILSEKFPSPCLVAINAISNLAGVAFAITAIVLYSICMGDIYFWNNCRADSWYYSSWETPPPTPPSASLSRMQENCLWYKSQVLLLVRGIIGVLIVLSTLQLCVTLSGCILGIKALCKNKNKDTEPDPELYKPVMENDTTE